MIIDDHVVTVVAYLFGITHYVWYWVDHQNSKSV